MKFSQEDLKELVDNPNEVLAVEYKSWLDLADNQCRADLARHIAALANHGGGYIVFGLSDDLTFAGPNPFSNVKYDRDTISSIVKKYLEPPFQCDMQMVRSSSGNDHPVIYVPPHGEAPICAIASGPHVNGKPKGIVQGAYYIRKVGPESAQISAAGEWGPLIRRCVTHDRASLLSSLDAAIRGIQTPNVTSAATMESWHAAAKAAFLALSKEKQRSDLINCHWQMTYAIEKSDATEEVSRDRLTSVLNEIHHEALDTVNTGWSMFYPFTRPGIQPIFVTDQATGYGDNDFLETALLKDSEDRVTHPDFWRISADGKATIIRNYAEDGSDINQHFQLTPGTWFSPNILARSLAEFVRHARGMAQRFESATSITFLCEWVGLSKRKIYDPWSFWSYEYPARADQRRFSKSFPIPALTNDWHSMVSDLAAPALRVFSNDFNLSTGWIAKQAPTWRRL